MPEIGKTRANGAKGDTWDNNVMLCLCICIKIRLQVRSIAQTPGKSVERVSNRWCWDQGILDVGVGFDAFR